METWSDFESTKQQIVLAAKSVFVKYGYNKVSMDDIAKAFGKSRSTLYHYFKNKKDIFELIAFAEFRNILCLAEKQVTEDKTIQENLIAYYGKKADTSNKLIQAYSSIIEEIRAHDDVFFKISKMQVEEEANVLKIILSWAMEKKQIASRKDRDIDFIAHVLVTALRSFEQEVFTQKKYSTYKAKLSILVDILCKGLQ
ncbi:TetR/AcrR family transcriptional regulator [Taibaiella sp. KBW10]|uniref:TetR/AcrR family transcriptional regulator n=1 Tax=Taibaiella sp. KBW10 TaxID=2153357 RepID=UPI001315A75C|nr:TetR/AcrR family transcriptional regulator [Taibaiella sp. KBW10]